MPTSTIPVMTMPTSTIPVMPMPTSTIPESWQCQHQQYQSHDNANINNTSHANANINNTSHDNTSSFFFIWNGQAKKMCHKILIYPWVENIMGKRGNAGYQHFLLFQRCLKNHSVSELLSVNCVVKSFQPYSTFCLQMFSIWNSLKTSLVYSYWPWEESFRTDDEKGETLRWCFTPI